MSCSTKGLESTWARKPPDPFKTSLEGSDSSGSSTQLGLSIVPSLSLPHRPDCSLIVLFKEAPASALEVFSLPTREGSWHLPLQTGRTLRRTSHVLNSTFFALSALLACTNRTRAMAFKRWHRKKVQMPFTPFHLGPALFFGLLLFRLVDFPTFLAASVILDLEPLAVLLLGLNYPLHGFFHSFLGGTIVAVILGLTMLRLSGRTREVLKLLALEQRSSLQAIMLGSLLGVYSHILLDSPLYADIRPFFPFGVNPFFAGDAFAGLYVYALCVLLFLAGVAAYAAMLIARARKKP